MIAVAETAGELQRERGRVATVLERTEEYLLTERPKHEEQRQRILAAVGTRQRMAKRIAEIDRALAALPLAVPVVAEQLDPSAYLGARGIVPESSATGTRVPS